MKKLSLSLKQSTFLTIIVASAFLLLVFTHLQLTREADNTAKHQIKETQLSILLAKMILESKIKLSKETAAPDNHEQTKKELMISLLELTKKVPALKEALLLSKTGVLIYPPNLTNPNASVDQGRIQEILLTPDWNGEWFRTLPTPGFKDSLDIYTPLLSPGGIEYVLKTTVSLDNLKTAFVRTYGIVLLIWGFVPNVLDFLVWRRAFSLLLLLLHTKFFYGMPIGILSDCVA